MMSGYEFFEPSQFSSGILVPKLILLFTASYLSDQPSFKNPVQKQAYQKSKLVCLEAKDYATGGQKKSATLSFSKAH